MAAKFACVLLVAAVGLCLPEVSIAQQKDYLSAVEADKIREATEPSERIKLFLGFAADRLRKFQFELARPASTPRRGEMLNRLLNAYTGCLDDAATLIELGQEKQQDISKGIKEMQKQAKTFLAYLEPQFENGQELALYKETLRDAIEATNEALAEAEKAAKDYTPPPVRRKQ